MSIERHISQFIKNSMNYKIHLNFMIGSTPKCRVYLGESRVNGAHVAIKIVDLSQMSRISVAKQRRGNIVQMVSHHKNIASVHGFELFMIIKDYKFFILEESAKSIVFQIVEAVHYLHSKNQCHRDIKVENIMMSATPQGQATVKIIDFGLARYKSQPWVRMTPCGTPGYIAPEVLQGHLYDEKADMWSIGSVMFA
eukprot:gene19557-23428_t